MRICKICNKEYELNEDGAGYKYCSKYCTDEARRKRNRERWREANPEWDKGINKVCEWCGKEFTVPARNAHIARFCSDKCRDTWHSREVKGHGTQDKYLKERKKQKQERRIKLKKERIQKIKTVKCLWCGKRFETIIQAQVTCSSKCSHKRRNRMAWERKEGRLNESNIVNKDITLEKLYQRDKGICHLCGGKCNFDDINITEEGYYITGKTYPSIDHVIPIAKGGKHSWNNVKIAHHRCNTLKRDNIIESGLKTLA